MVICRNCCCRIYKIDSLISEIFCLINHYGSHLYKIRFLNDDFGGTNKSRTIESGWFWWWWWLIGILDLDWLLFFLLS